MISPGTEDQPIADGPFAKCFEPLHLRLHTDLALGCCQYRQREKTVVCVDNRENQEDSYIRLEKCMDKR